MIASDAVWGFLAGAIPLARGDVVLTLATYTVMLTVLGLAAVGAVLLHRRNCLAASIIAVPLLLVLVASISGLYPMRGRLEIFIMLPFAVLVAASIQWLATHFDNWVLPASSLPLLTLGAVNVTVPSQWPYQWEELRPVVAAIEAQSVKAPVYIYANAGPAWLYYTTEWSRPDTARLDNVMKLIGFGGSAFENAAQLTPGQDVRVPFVWRGRSEYYGRSAGVPWSPYINATSRPMRHEWIASERAIIESLAKPKVWLIFAHYRGTENGLLDAIEADGLRQQESVRAKGAAAFLYQLRSDFPR
jgi:hypothetical protein